MMTSFDLELRRNRAFGFSRKPNTTLFQHFMEMCKGNRNFKEDDDDGDDYEDNDGYEGEDG